MHTYVVVCLDDHPGPAKPEAQQYVLATRQVFSSLKMAEQYARTISERRQPIVVCGDWGGLRLLGRAA